MKRFVANFILRLLESWTGFNTNSCERLSDRVRLYLLRKYELPVCKQIHQTVRPGMVVVDIGANIGYITRELAYAVGPTGKVLAFEPNPQIFAILERNMRHYPQVQIFPFAIGERESELELRFSRNQTGRASFYAVDNSATESVVVKIRPLIQVLSEKGVTHVDFLKIDVEGAEISALSTLTIESKLLPMVIIAEFNPTCQLASGHSFADFWNWFAKLGYSLERLDDSGLHPMASPAELELASAALLPNQSLDVYASISRSQKEGFGSFPPS
jgi:FkbM family methyltransferase